MRTSNVALRLQPALLEAAREIAKSEGVALNQIINVAVAQMIAAHHASTYIEMRARRADLPRAVEILNRAGVGNPPMEGDELAEPAKPQTAPAARKSMPRATRNR